MPWKHGRTTTPERETFSRVSYLSLSLKDAENFSRLKWEGMGDEKIFFPVLSEERLSG